MWSLSQITLFYYYLFFFINVPYLFWLLFIQASLTQQSTLCIRINRPGLFWSCLNQQGDLLFLLKGGIYVIALQYSALPY